MARHLILSSLTPTLDLPRRADLPRPPSSAWRRRRQRRQPRSCRRQGAKRRREARPMRSALLMGPLLLLLPLLPPPRAWRREPRRLKPLPRRPRPLSRRRVWTGRQQQRRQQQRRRQRQRQRQQHPQAAGARAHSQQPLKPLRHTLLMLKLALGDGGQQPLRHTLRRPALPAKLTRQAPTRSFGEMQSPDIMQAPTRCSGA